MINIGTIRLAPNVQDLFLPLPANFIAEIAKGANLLFQGKIINKKIFNTSALVEYKVRH
jgi:hypothetical protein